MKRKRGLSVMLCLSFVALLSLAGGATNVQAREGGAKTAVKNESGEAAAKSLSEEKEEFKKNTKEKIAELGKKIDELEIKAKEAGAKAKSESGKGLRQLRKKMAALKKDVKKLEASGRKKWEAAKQKVNDTIDDIEKTYDKVLSRSGSE
jgi:hypothetical protein